MSQKLSNENIAAILKAQAWERAKGELKSMLHCSYDDTDRYTELSGKIDEFISRVEGDGLHEY